MAAFDYEEYYQQFIASLNSENPSFDVRYVKDLILKLGLDPMKVFGINWTTWKKILKNDKGDKPMYFPLTFTDHTGKVHNRICLACRSSGPDREYMYGSCIIPESKFVMTNGLPNVRISLPMFGFRVTSPEERDDIEKNEPEKISPTFFAFKKAYDAILNHIDNAKDEGQAIMKLIKDAPKNLLEILANYDKYAYIVKTTLETAAKKTQVYDEIMTKIGANPRIVVAPKELGIIGENSFIKTTNAEKNPLSNPFLIGKPTIAPQGNKPATTYYIKKKGKGEKPVLVKPLEVVQELYGIDMTPKPDEKDKKKMVYTVAQNEAVTKYFDQLLPRNNAVCISGELTISSTSSVNFKCEVRNVIILKDDQKNTATDTLILDTAGEEDAPEPQPEPQPKPQPEPLKPSKPTTVATPIVEEDDEEDTEEDTEEEEDVIVEEPPRPSKKTFVQEPKVKKQPKKKFEDDASD